MQAGGIPDQVRSAVHSLNRDLSGTNPTSHEYMAMEPGRISPSVSNCSTCPLVGSGKTGHSSLTASKYAIMMPCSHVTNHFHQRMLSLLDIDQGSLDDYLIQSQLVWSQYDHLLRTGGVYLEQWQLRIYE